MTDFTWPSDMPPFEQAFWLQPHTGGQESPFSRSTKVYELGAARWMCSMSVRGGYWGTAAQEAFGPRMDGLIAKLKGRANRIRIPDFRRSPRGALASATGNYAATIGATQITISGMTPATTVHAGDYVGGDGRPHIIEDDMVVDSSGNATVSFDPPLQADIPVNGAYFSDVTALFRLADDDAGQNGVAVGEAQVMTLNFVEDAAMDVSVPTDGLVGLWVISDRVSSPSAAIPNRASSASLSKNLFRGSRRLFSDTTLWLATSTTVTDNTVAGPDGTVDASTFVGTGNWRVAPYYTNPFFVAGAYTVAASVRRNTTSDQPFAFTKDAGSTRSTVHSATSAWKRFSYTFTLGSTTAPSNIAIGSSDGSTAGNIQIRDLELFRGSRDLGPVTPDGHLYLDDIHINAGTYASGIQSAAIGVIQFAQTQNLTNFTAQYCVEVTSGGAYNGVLADAKNYSNFSLASESWNGPMGISAFDSSISNKNSTGQVYQYRPGLFNLQGTGYHVFTYRYDGVALELWIDDVRLFREEETLTRQVRDFLFGTLAMAAGAGSNNHSGFTALWARALTDAEIRQTVASQQSINSVSGIVTSGVTDDRIYVAEGDSISGGNGPDCYPFKYGAHDSPAVIGTVWAVAGSTLANLVTRAPLVDDVIPPNTNGRTFLLSVLIGANDLATYPGASDAAAATAYTTALAAYCDARRAAGFKVVVGTILPRTNATHNTRRALVNAQIVTWSGTHADGIADFAADATMGPDAAASNTTYYPDGTHPSAAGHLLLEAIIRPVLNGL